jgi:CrcB protein
MSALSYFAVAAGGAVGAVMRYAGHRALTAVHGAEAAWSTLAINVAGSFGLGLAAAYFASRQSLVGTLVMIGVLGAFTTFSTFALDAVTLFRERGATAAALYVGLSVVLALAAFIAGHALMRGGA